MKNAASGAVVIAGISTGTGKTTVSMALMRLLSINGIAVAPFKVGPDFIDPQFHEKTTGMRSVNLDGFMTSADYIRRAVAARESEGSFCVIEGMMGLFDGLSAGRDFASTAWVSKVLDAPVVMVLDASATMRTSAAVAWGLREYARRRGVRVAGVILTKTASKPHFEGCKRAIEATGVTVFGHIPETPEFAIKERHLGLSLQGSIKTISSLADSMALCLGKSLDPGAFLRRFRRSPRHVPALVEVRKDARVRIGVAADFAFNFYYHDNLDLLRRAGADVVPFSPVSGDSVDMFDGLYIGGGYPELYASSISVNASMLSSMRKAVENGMPVYAECGGFMMLCRKLEVGSSRYRMAGVFDASVKLTRSPAIGYRKVRTSAATPLGRKGLNARGHEFHYARLTTDTRDEASKPFKVWKAEGKEHSGEGFVSGNAVGSFLHLHFGSNPSLAGNLVRACSSYSRS